MAPPPFVLNHHVRWLRVDGQPSIVAIHPRKGAPTPVIKGEDPAVAERRIEAGLREDLQAPTHFTGFDQSDSPTAHAQHLIRRHGKSASPTTRRGALAKSPSRSAWRSGRLSLASTTRQR